MKNIILLMVAVFGLLLGSEVYAQQGIGTDLPEKSAALEIRSGKRGLLIPRFEIENLMDSAPVTDPANGLLVFNEGNGIDEPGFYWWNETANEGQGAWVPVTIHPDSIDVSVTDDNNGVVTVTEDPENENHFEVGLELGLDGQFLATVKNEVTDELEPQWMHVNELIQAGNGLRIDENDDFRLKLGGVLTDDLTTIETDLKDKELEITNLYDITTDINTDPSSLADFDIIMLENDVLRKMSATQFISETVDIDADNGLHYDSDEDKYHLGGQLHKATKIETGEESEEADSDNTLAITGLEEVDTANKIVVAEDVGGVLRTVNRKFTYVITTNNLNLNADNDYSVYTQEIYIQVDVSNLGSDRKLTLPGAGNHEGQIIYVRITDDSDNGEPNGYLNINDSEDNELTYGSMPTQGWVLKSNGANWQVIAKN